MTDNTEISLPKIRNLVLVCVLFGISHPFSLDKALVFLSDGMSIPPSVDEACRTGPYT